MRKSTKRTIAIAAVTLLLLGGGTAAFAYWTAGGAGTGTAAASAGTDVVTVNQTTVLTGIGPGVATQTISGTFTNPSTGPVYVTSVTASIASVTKAAGAPAGTCAASDFTLASAAMPVGIEVPVGAAVGAWTGATLAFNDTATNQDACKGATVNLAYVAA